MRTKRLSVAATVRHEVPERCLGLPVGPHLPLASHILNGRISHIRERLISPECNNELFHERPIAARTVFGLPSKEDREKLIHCFTDRDCRRPPPCNHAANDTRPRQRRDYAESVRTRSPRQPRLDSLRRKITPRTDGVGASSNRAAIDPLVIAVTIEPHDRVKLG